MEGTSTPVVNPKSVEALIEEVERVVETRRDTYRRRATWHARFFRATGISVIAIATALPVLASLSYDGKTVTVAVAGALVAFLTALRSFYQWDQLWALLRQCDLDLTHLLEQWKLDVAATAGLPETERRTQVHALATNLLEQAETLRRAESLSYFGMLRFPQGAQPGTQK
jgi:hypothetical protein